MCFLKLTNRETKVWIIKNNNKIHLHKFLILLNAIFKSNS